MKQQVNKRCIEEISVDPCKSHLAQFDLRNCFECLTSHKHLKWKSSEFVEVDRGKRVNLIGISVRKKVKRSLYCKKRVTGCADIHDKM